MTALATDLDPGNSLARVDTPLVNPTYPLFYDLGAETIKVVAHADTDAWEIERGASDSAATFHAKGTPLVANASPFGAAGGGIPQGGPLTEDLDPGGFALAAAADGGSTGGVLTVHPESGVNGGGVVFSAGSAAGGNGAVAQFGGGSDEGGGWLEEGAGAGGADLPGGSVTLTGGDGDDGNDAGASITVGGGDGAGNPGTVTFVNPGGPVIPLTVPTVQNVIDALVTLGLVTQSD